nr:hypothetical protein [Tanacetum cinerariifolium]
METQKPLLKDKDGKEVDVHMYGLMIGSLMYLTSSRPDIMFAVCACARYQVNPKVSHLYAVKRISSDYAEASLDRKSTIGGKAKKSVRLMMEKLFGMELELIQVPEPSNPTKSVADEAVYKELGDRLVRAATTASILEAKQDSSAKKPWRYYCSNQMVMMYLLNKKLLLKNEVNVVKEVVEVIKNTKLIVDATEVSTASVSVSAASAATTVNAATTTTATITTINDKRRKHFASKRAEEKRNKPQTKAQQRKIMCTYLKNMEGYKLKDLKLKEFDSIQEMFDKAFKRVNTFEDFRTELVKGKEKRAGEELVQEITKKKKVEDDKEKAELK